MMGFGTHLMIDGYGGDGDRLQDLDGLYRFLDEYPDRMGMTKIMPPYVFMYVGSKPEDWGLSGVVLIAESHISVHTFPEKGFVSVDFFSCKRFDMEAAVKEVEAVFKLKKVDVNSLDRGREFPKDIEQASSLVRQDRLVRFG
jgi:S-adenosylmethionine decarboxylase